MALGTSSNHGRLSAVSLGGGPSLYDFRQEFLPVLDRLLTTASSDFSSTRMCPDRKAIAQRALEIAWQM